MTTREFLNTVQKMMADMANFELYATDPIRDVVYDKAGDLLAALDKKNESRKSKPSKVAIANAPIKEAIINHLNEVKHATASEVAEALGMTTQKASALLRQLALDGVFTVSEVKVPKKGAVKNYSVTE
jgi:hypothetical protein